MQSSGKDDPPTILLEAEKCRFCHLFFFKRRRPLAANEVYIFPPPSAPLLAAPPVQLNEAKSKRLAE